MSEIEKATSEPPRTHILLPFKLRDLIIERLGEVPSKYGVHEIVTALRNAPTCTVTPTAPPAPDTPPAG